MPRKYTSKQGGGKKKYAAYDPEDLKNAINAVKKEGSSIKSAAKKHNVNIMTLKRSCRKLNQELPCYKNRQIFTTLQETELGQHLIDMAIMYYGLTVMQFRKLAYEYAVLNHIEHPSSWDATGQTGRDWYRGFIDRNPIISLRTPEPTSLARATAFNRHTVGEFFGNLKTVYDKHSFPPERVWNTDETGLTTVHKPSKVLATKGMKQVGKITSAERGELITLCACINAAGGHIPPFIIFPRKNWQDRFLAHAPPSSIGVAHPSGWMNADNFLKFLQHFVYAVQPSVERKHLLIMDNHESHCSLQAVLYAKENGIVLLTFPPHTTHKLQPLDRTVFGPLKAYYSNAASNFMLGHPGKTITLYDIAELLSEAFPRAMSPSNIISGFRATGICPVNPDIFSDHEFMASAVTDRPPPSPLEDGVPLVAQLEKVVESPPQCSELAVLPENIVVGSPQCSQLAVQPKKVMESPPHCSELAVLPENIVVGSPQCSQLAVQVEPPVSVHHSPKDIMPFPKAGARVQRGGRQRGRTRVLTDTPEKAIIEEKTMNKIAKANKVTKTVTKEEKNQKKIPIKRKLFNIDETSDSDEWPTLSSSSGGEWSENSSDNEPGYEPIKKIVNEFVVVEYNKTLYPGQITSISDEGATIKAMQRNGKLWKWPPKEDILFYQ